MTASAFSQNSHLRLRLVHAQWSLAPDENFEKPPCQIPDSSDCFGIQQEENENMIMEIIVGVIGLAFILLVIFLITALQRLLKVVKKTDHVLTEVHYLLHSLSEPTMELIDNTNNLILDVKKKSEGLDVLFRPLYGLKKEKPDRSKYFEKISDLLECVGEGIQLFNKIKNEMKR